MWIILLAGLLFQPFASAYGTSITREKIVSDYRVVSASKWGDEVNGVRTCFNTEKKCIALTFDACGSKEDDCDWKLINYLKAEKVPATLFISGRWIDAHTNDFRKIAKETLFEIENHGLNHKPCSINGRSAYGITGTDSPGEVYDEIEINAQKIFKLTGAKTLFYRSGTAYYDEVAVSIIHRMGYTPVGFNVLGDAGATYSSLQVKNALISAHPGSIVICHMNHSKSGTAEGVKSAIPELKKKGFSFVRLSECSFAVK